MFRSNGGQAGRALARPDAFGAIRLVQDPLCSLPQVPIALKVTRPARGALGEAKTH